MAKRAKPEEKYPVEVHWSEEDQAFIAAVYDLPGCLGDGATEADAIRAAHEVAGDWLAVARKEGREVPGPSSEEPTSGTFNLRIPPSLHRELKRRARREHVSLNQLATMLLARGAPG
jgi:antitoxin HicB